MDGRYLAAVSPGRGIRIFGYRVSFLSLRHVWALEMIGSPYAVGGEVTIEDVVAAAYIVSRRDDQALAKAFAPAGWWRSLWRELAGLLRGWRFRRQALDEVEKLEAFFEAEKLTPRIMNQGPGGRRMASPWMEVMRCRVAEKCGISLADAWWTRFADAAWAGVVWQEMEGAKFKLIDDKLLEELEELGWTEEDFA